MVPRIIKIEKLKFLEKDIFNYSEKFRVCFIIAEKREIPIQWVRFCILVLEATP